MDNAYPFQDAPFLISKQVVFAWRLCVIKALSKYGKNCAGMEPVEMMEAVSGGRLRLFVMGSDPLIELFVEKGDWSKMD